jgi:hypothetical protein
MMFLAIRKYARCKDIQEVNRRVVATLTPALRALPGYQSYSVVDLGDDTVASISVFDTREQADSATQQVRGLVQQHLADLMPHPPEVTIGEILSESPK